MRPNHTRSIPTADSATRSGRGDKQHREILWFMRRILRTRFKTCIKTDNLVPALQAWVYLSINTNNWEESKSSLFPSHRLERLSSSPSLGSLKDAFVNTFFLMTMRWETSKWGRIISKHSCLSLSPSRHYCLKSFNLSSITYGFSLAPLRHQRVREFPQSFSGHGYHGCYHHIGKGWGTLPSSDQNLLNI